MYGPVTSTDPDSGKAKTAKQLQAIAAKKRSKVDENKRPLASFKAILQDVTSIMKDSFNLDVATMSTTNQHKIKADIKAKTGLVYTGHCCVDLQESKQLILYCAKCLNQKIIHVVLIAKWASGGKAKPNPFKKSKTSSAASTASGASVASGASTASGASAASAASASVDGPAPVQLPPIIVGKTTIYPSPQKPADQIGEDQDYISLKILEVFPHDSECEKPLKERSTYRLDTQHCGSGLFPGVFPHAEIIRGTYDKMVQKQLSYKNPLVKSPPGAHLDNDVHDYPWDDRRFEPLPSSANYKDELDPVEHRFCFIRIWYFLASALNASREFSSKPGERIPPFDSAVKPDKSITFPANLFAGYNVDQTPAGRKAYARNPGTVEKALRQREAIHQFSHHDFLPLEVAKADIAEYQVPKSPTAVLAPVAGATTTVSRASSPPTVENLETPTLYQKDGIHWVSVSQNGKLFGKLKPGTVIIPLHDFRTIYLGNGKKRVDIHVGQYLYFAGDVDHGGWTYDLPPKGQNATWHPSLHMYLESEHHMKAKASIHLQVKPGNYCPPQHLVHMDKEQNIACLKEVGDYLQTSSACSVVHKTKAVRNEAIRIAQRVLGIAGLTPPADFKTTIAAKIKQKPTEEDIKEAKAVLAKTKSWKLE